MKKINAAGYYFMYSLAMSVIAVYLSIYLEYDLGFSEKQITNVFFVQSIIMLVIGPIGAFISDKVKRKSLFGSMFFLVNGIVLLALGANITEINVIYVLLILHFTFKSFGPGLVDKILFEMQDEGLIEFFKVRGWGALGYALGAIFVAYFIADEYRVIFIIAGAFYVFNSLQILFMVTKGDAAETSGINFADILDLITNKRIVFISFLHACLFGVATVNYNIRGLYIEEITLAMSFEVAVGIMILLNSILELPLMQVTGKLIEKNGFKRMFLFALILNTFMYLGYFLSHVIDSQILFFASVSINGIIMAVYISSMMQWVRISVPKSQFATAAAIPLLFSTLGTVIFTKIVGYIWVSIGLNWAYVFLAFISVIAAITVVIYFRSEEYE